MQPKLFDALRRGATLVTANSRLARRLRQEYNALQASERSVWPSPAILPWSAWLEALWQDLLFRSDTEAPVRIGRARERVVWQSVIEASPEGARLLQPGAA